jgi:eukaryotic-like serine/threonine-protein kinase
MSSSSGPTPAVTAAVKTLLVTDLVGSTALLAQLGDRRGAALFARIDRLARDLLAQFDGREIDRTDGYLMLFDRPVDATRWALAYHAALISISDEQRVPLAARVGIHIGEVYLRNNPDADIARGAKAIEVDGIAKATAARLASLAGGQQTLLTAAAFDAVREDLGGRLVDAATAWLAHGAYVFKGVDEPVDVFEIGAVGAAPLDVPADTPKAQRSVRPGDEVTLGWRPAPGQEISKRPGWIIAGQLGAGGFGETWLAVATATGEQRVFKFCFRADRLRALRREVAIVRLINEALGDRDDIVRVLDWHFDEPPFFLESEYAPGGDLTAWATRRGGLLRVPLAERLEIVAQVADALGAAHSVGVLHKDLKPANVLVAAMDGPARARLGDFGVGAVDTHTLTARGITAHGFTQATSDTSLTGTYSYMAPEIVEGRTPTIQADLYSLGVILYQMAVGDFGRVVTASWARDVSDDLLREDIAALLDGVPERRPTSAAIVAAQLRALDSRRDERARIAREQAQAEADRAALVVAQRRRRQFTIAAAIATVVLAVVSVLAVQASRARSEANLRRGQAEDLFGFLLGDLRARLKPVGRLDLLDEVGARAVGYFDSLPASIRTDADLVRHARTLSQIGQVRLDQGRLPDARRAFEQSLAIVREVVARSPREADWRFELGQSEFWMGDVLRREGDLTGALGHWQAYLGVAKALVALDASRAEWQLELGYAHGNIGTLLETRGDYAGAAAAYRESMAIKKTVAVARPTDTQAQVDLAVSHNKIATVLEPLGDLHGSLREFEAELAIRQALSEADSRNADWKRRLAIAHNRIGLAHLMLGQPDEALSHFELHRGIVTALVALDPANLQWRRDMAIAHQTLGFVARDQGRHSDAERQFETALATLEPLVQRPSATPQWLWDFAYVRRLLAETRFDRGDGAPETEARDIVAELDALLARAPEDRLVQRELAFALMLQGRIHARGGRRKEAQAAWLRAEQTVRDARDGSDPGLLDAWASSLIYLGKGTEAAGPVSRLTGMGYRRRAFLQLGREHGLIPYS